MSTVPRPEPRVFQRGALSAFVDGGRWADPSNRQLRCAGVTSAHGLDSLLEQCALTCAPEPVLRVDPATAHGLVLHFEVCAPPRARGARPALADYTAASLTQLDGEQRLRENARRLLHAVAFACDQLAMPRDYHARPAEFETGCRSVAAADRVAFVLPGIEVPLRIFADALAVLGETGLDIVQYAITRAPGPAAMRFEFVIPAQ